MKATYRAIEEKDGTYSILDVPVFCEVPEGTKGAPANIGRKWMERAIGAADRLEKENGYLPPLNYGHHKEGSSEPVRKIGHFRLRRAKSMQFEDKEQHVLTADFVKLPKEEFERFMRGEYPYRSVEISDWNDPRINHLSVLAHQEPHFKLPMTNGDTIRLDETTTAAQKATCGAERALAILFCEDTEIHMAKTATPADAAKAARLFLAKVERGEIDLDGNPVRRETGAAADEPTDAEFADFARKAIALSGGEVEKDATEADLAAFGRELLDEADIDETGADDDPTPAELDGKNAAKLAAIEDKADKAVERVATFEAAQKSEKDTAERLRKAEADLAGYNLGSKTKAALAEFAKTGGKPFEDFIASVKEHATREPIAFDAQAVETDPVLKGLNVKPEDAEDAVRFAAEYEEMSKLGLLPGISKKDHVLSQFQSREARANFAATAGAN